MVEEEAPAEVAAAGEEISIKVLMALQVEEAAEEEEYILVAEELEVIIITIQIDQV